MLSGTQKGPARASNSRAWISLKLEFDRSSQRIDEYATMTEPEISSSLGRIYEPI